MNMKLIDLLKEVYKGSVVLPDFQRSFIWEPEDIRELLVSVLGGYFVGSMLLLELHKDESPFALRLIEGVREVNKDVQMQSIVKILLDGQQRTTALFYALYEPNIPLKGKRNPYKFFLDIEKALNEQWNDAAIAVNDRRIEEIKKRNNIIPFSLFTDIGEVAKKFNGNSKFAEIISLVNNFQNYEIHIVSLSRGTDLEKIVETFERINRTGEPLSIFELLTARLYKYGIKLRDLLEKVKEDYEKFKKDNEFVKFIPPEFILKVIALIRGKEIKRSKILELEPQDFEKDWEIACKALNSAYKRITDLKDGYGVLDFKKWMPYTSMIVPLAAMINYINKEGLETMNNYKKIDCWYWVSVFSNRYDKAVETTSANDYATLKKWINDDTKVPDFIRNFNLDETDLDVDKQSSAIYRGVINMIVLEGALDFKTGQPPQFNAEKIQDDHIFPKSVYNDNRIPNRTLISTNAEKSNRKPSEYFKQILNIHGEEVLKKILASHIIPSDALEDLLNENKENFINKRKKAIIECLKKKLNYEN